MQSDGFCELLGERSRLLIMTALAAAPERVDFMRLQESVALTKGNLSAHLRKLEEEGFVEVEKRFVDRKPCTSYGCTERGRAAMKAHLDAIERLLRVALKR